MAVGARELADLAAEQWGFVTTAQARSFGMSSQAVARAADRGVLERMSHGVYRLAGSPPDPLDDLRVAWLTLDSRQPAGERIRVAAPAVVSHRSAAGVHGLGDLEADAFEFTTEGRKQSRRADVRLHRGPVAGAWVIVDGLPVTSVARTVADLAATRVDGGHLAAVVRDALTVRHVDVEDLSAALAPHAHHYGAGRGEGEELVARFLQESGVSVPISRAVELAGEGSLQMRAVATAMVTSPGFKRLQEQVAAIQRSLAPLDPAGARAARQAAAALAGAAGAREAVASMERAVAPALETVAGIQRMAEMPAATAELVEQSETTRRAVARAVAEFSSRGEFAQLEEMVDQIHEVVASPGFQRMLAEARTGEQAEDQGQG